MEKKTPELIFCPCPGIGHMISAVELAKHITGGHGQHFHVTILTMQHHYFAWAAATTSYINSVISSGLDIQFEDLPLVQLPYKENMKGETFMCLFIEAHKNHVRDAVSRRLATGPVAALVLDVMCASMIDLAKELAVPSYIYMPSNATFLGLMLYLPTLHVKVPLEIEDVKDVINIPVLHSAPPSSMPTFMADKKDEAYTMLLDYGYRMREATGFIVNTFVELEMKQLEALEKGECVPDQATPVVFPIGPLVVSEEQEKHECIKWLDEQPAKSVLFLCFGSVGCFTKDLVKEIALGLERSGQRFLWVLRTPAQVYNPIAGDVNLDDELPEGFLERTKERGLVWPAWIPQLSVLAHSAVAGFVTHCGWNSILESLWHGVPMLAWPLYAEQHMNAVLVVREMGVGLELKVDRKNGGFVSSEALESGIRSLMEGEEGRKVRQRAEQMKVSGRKAVEEGGSSYASLELLVHQIIKNIAA
ncbi:UDP-glucuronosyl/UDP-glucosyltransferase protein [Dioscorea alata]|uniref:UDP-glucuronosyl/UDP-glucosyltransferase protein n=1 Tax=Dioscorea alata TaxID=55571 RepID=A0ACB7UNA8_DIOAL|nr:UDP-glucuronosyl/UDP-glucosyltransferase protein [Dioscorea alata]